MRGAAVAGRLLGGAALAMLTIGMAPALAQATAGKPPPSSEPSRPMPATPGAVPSDLAGPACTLRQVPVFNAAMAEARSRIAAAVRLVREEPGHPYVRTWFGDAPSPVVLGVLHRTATRLANTAGLEVHCNDPARCEPRLTAYAQGLSRVLLDRNGEPAVTYRLQEGLVLGLCPPFFRAGMEGTGTRWGILIHEATHFAAETKDHVYGRAPSLALARENGRRAAENADNYQHFVETLPRP